MNENEVRRTLQELSFVPKRQRGQNFLIDESALLTIAGYLSPEPFPLVEIGPGLGALTRYLRRLGRPLRVVELEPQFCRYLQTHLGLPANDINQANILDLDPQQFGSPIEIVSNVPYSISSELLQWLIRHRSNIFQATLLLQNDFAERIAAVPGTRAYGSLSVYCQMYADAELRGEIYPGHLFYPPTEVSSRILQLRFRTTPRFALKREDLLSAVLKAAFAQKRKTLVNSLIAGLHSSRAEVVLMLQELGIEPTRRAETLSLAEFAAIANYLASS